jgi:hypothetical protein
MLDSPRWFARSIVAVLCASLAVALMGATTSLLPPPTLVIFSFTPADGADPNSGTEFAKQLGAALTTLGGVKVVMADAATVPANYLRTAKTAGGDYYLMGHIAPAIKNSLPVIEQIVSARSGIVVWSETAHVSSDDDVANQAPTVKNAVTSYAARGYATILNATPGPVRTVKPATTPAPKKVAAASADGPGGVPGPGGVIIGPDGVPRLPNEAYGFSSKPTALPKVYASASRPSRFVVLSFAGKSVTPVIREYTVDSLVRTLKTHGQSVAEGDPAALGHHLPGPDVCADTGGRYLVFGTIEATSQAAAESNNYVSLVNTALNVTVYNCATGKFEKPTILRGRGMPWQNSVDNATSTAVNRYLMKLATLATSS